MQIRECEPWKELDKNNGRSPERWHKGRPYDERPFIAWDGEGITFPGSPVQSYVLFGNSEGDSIRSTDLSSVECFELLLRAELKCPEAIHVGFSMQYDFNMMFKDLPRPVLNRIYKTHKAKWNGYRIEYFPGKWLTISKRGLATIRLFDVFGFFQSSFVKAVAEFLGTDDPEYQRVVNGKDARKSFTFDQLDSYIVPYWRAELRLLVRVMESLREDLHQADLHIQSWHGPGAVANTVFRTNRIQSCKGESPSEVNRAAQYAYAGGRFELFRAGHFPHPVYQYDICSAYPSIIAGLPTLNNPSWSQTSSLQRGTFSIYRVRYQYNGSVRQEWNVPHPLFYRDLHGHVSYPGMVETWVWEPEAALLDSSAIIEGYVLHDTGDRPFTFVEEMYKRRRQWKDNGISAQRALKLALNSLYGKMAQRAGWSEGEPIPRWHQLEWAGYVTSATRAKLYGAISALADTPNAILAVETDAIFSSVPFPTSEPSLVIGKGLGEWEETTYDAITYLQSGVYWAEQNGKVIDKYRGFDKGTLPHEAAMAYLTALDKAYASGRDLDSIPNLSGVTTRFIGMGLGLHTKAVWRSWETEPRALRFGGGGKRSHVWRLCPECQQGIPFSESLHSLAIITPGGRSQPHSLPWMEGAEASLRALDELSRW